MNSAAAKALIVDYGGVLTTSVFESFETFCMAAGLPPDALKNLLIAASEGEFADGPITRFEKGEITDQDFEAALAEELSMLLDSPISAQDLRQRIFAMARPDPVMSEAVRTLRLTGVKTALLSNSWGAGAYNREVLAQIFDEVVISAELGVRKPNPQAFLHTAKLLGVDPRECVFIDDLEAHVRGATSVGMRGLLHQDRNETLRALEELFSVSFDTAKVV